MLFRVIITIHCANHIKTIKFANVARTSRSLLHQIRDSTQQRLWSLVQLLKAVNAGAPLCGRPQSEGSAEQMNCCASLQAASGRPGTA
jgi:hypothetical protein